MDKILILTPEPFEAERERVEHLSSRMPGYEFFFFSPADFRGLFKELRFNRGLKKAADIACLVLVSPSTRAERMRSLGNKPVRPLPEGVDFDAFNSAAERNLPFPDDLFTIKNPIIGHLGPIDSHANLQPVEKAAEAHPEWSFVFVGPVLTDVTALEEFPNVRLLGEKPRYHLPAYISRFDVCVNIAKDDDASAENLYQYMAAGKPVVSAPHPARALDYADAIYLAGTPEEFICLCKKAIGERDAWKVRRRIEYGRAASWDARAAELERMIKELCQ
jgi:glycosyltransferase involved in cell wall biosynthesis